jgi:hypothetical protein
MTDVAITVAMSSERIIATRRAYRAYRLTVLIHAASWLRTSCGPPHSRRYQRAGRRRKADGRSTSSRCFYALDIGLGFSDESNHRVNGQHPAVSMPSISGWG